MSLGIITLASLPYEILLRRCPSERYRKLAAGIILTCCAVASMAIPVQAAPGVMFDLRHVFLILAASHGGLFAALLMAAATGLYRLYLGGAGVEAGLLGIAISATLGYVLARVFSGEKTSFGVLLVFGVAASLSTSSLLVLPFETVGALVQSGGVLLFAANLVGVVMTGHVLNRQQILLAREQALTEDATVDALTGLVNRRAFDRLAPDLIRASLAKNMPCALMLIDADHFKRINDTFGHAAGDLVLRSIAETLSNVARERRLVARFGGEEFAIVLPETSATDAEAFADEVRRAVASVRHDVRGLPLRVTVSVGVHTVTSPSETIMSAFQKADAALYRAKAGGRNQVQFARAA
nr:diguanylate cyclase [Aurantimonas sp. VKM B-3413]